MAITFYERSRNVGLAGGSLWLIIVGIAYAAWSLPMIRSSLAISLLTAMCILAVGMYLFGIAMILRVRRLSFLAASTSEKRERRRIWRQFAMIFAAECIAIAIISEAGMAYTHHWRYTVPPILIIVGLHFLPLAKLFAVPRYYVTGLLFCAISIATMLSLPSSSHVGHALSWVAIPSVGCALVSLATAWAGLKEVRRFLVVSRVRV